MREFNEEYERLQALGLDPIPIKPGFKHPNVNNWQSRQFKWDALWTGWGIGHRTHTIGALDADIKDERLAKRFRRYIFDKLGAQPYRIGFPPKWACLVKNGYGGKISSPLYGEHKVEFLGNGQQIVLFHLHPDTGNPYRWVKRFPDALTLEQIPFIERSHAVEIIEYFGSITGLEPVGRTRISNSSVVNGFPTWEAKRRTAFEKHGMREDCILPFLKVIKDKGHGKYEIICPWGDEHSNGIKTGACYWSGVHIIRPKFICLHETCKAKERGYEDLVYKFLRS